MVKKNGSRVDYDRDKLKSSMMLALRKRPVTTESVEGAIDRIEAMLAGPLGELRDAPQPIFKGKLKELRAVAVEVRAHGVARAVGRPVPGVHAFSAPAFSHEGEPVIVVTALDHQDRLSADWDCASATAVREAAAEISRRLGWSAPPSTLAG